MKPHAASRSAIRTSTGRTRAAYARPAGLVVRRVPSVQHELVAVRIGEDRHVADAGVEGVAEELDTLGLEGRAHLADVIAAQRPRVPLLGDERHAVLLGLPDSETGVAGPLLPLGVLVGTQPQHASVEGPGAVGVPGGDAEEVESFDNSHGTRRTRIEVNMYPPCA